MKWYSVKDKLPKDFSIPDEKGTAQMCEYECVFVYSDKNGPDLIGIAQMRDNKWEILGDGGANSCGGIYDLSSEDITHWRSFDYPKESE